ncbi:MAG TPA: hypothetical protein VKZ53_24015 [Candidatus Angelobacter sp.]|nr:hypothetical protein [Candidatus Angelobacter sp.]
MDSAIKGIPGKMVEFGLAGADEIASSEFWTDKKHCRICQAQVMSAIIL